MLVLLASIPALDFKDKVMKSYLGVIRVSIVGHCTHLTSWAAWQPKIFETDWFGKVLLEFLWATTYCSQHSVVISSTLLFWSLLLRIWHQYQILMFHILE